MNRQKRRAEYRVTQNQGSPEESQENQREVGVTARRPLVGVSGLPTPGGRPGFAGTWQAIPSSRMAP
jgi:hypothetical protein